MHEMFTLLFSHTEEPKVNQNFISDPNRYGLTYQSEIDISIVINNLGITRKHE
jgi:hypothetical protein